MLTSIVICTYNRGDALKATLDSFFIQEGLSDFSYELILIDNNSKDHTRELIATYILQHPDHMKYFVELSQGVSFARNRGIRESRGDIIVFTDDDVVIDKYWLVNIVGVFQESQADAVGGRVLPVYPLNTPNWIIENQSILCGPIVSYNHGEKVGLHKDITLVMPIGANMAFRREIFTKFGTFRTDFGPGVGTMGEDMEFFMRFSNNPVVKLYYCGPAVILHPVERSRMTLRYLAKWMIAAGRFWAIDAMGDKNAPSFVVYFGVPRYLIRRFIFDVFCLFFTSINRRKLLKHYLRIFCDLGMIMQFRKQYLCPKSA